MEWDYSGRKGRDGQKKKIGKANERKGKVKKGKYDEVNGQGERGVPRPHTGLSNKTLVAYLPISGVSSKPVPLVSEFLNIAVDRLGDRGLTQ